MRRSLLLVPLLGLSLAAAGCSREDTIQRHEQAARDDYQKAQEELALGKSRMRDEARAAQDKANEKLKDARDEQAKAERERLAAASDHDRSRTTDDRARDDRDRVAPVATAGTTGTTTTTRTTRTTTDADRRDADGRYADRRYDDRRYDDRRGDDRRVIDRRSDDERLRVAGHDDHVGTGTSARGDYPNGTTLTRDATVRDHVSSDSFARDRASAGDRDRYGDRDRTPGAVTTRMVSTRTDAPVDGTLGFARTLRDKLGDDWRVSDRQGAVVAVRARLRRADDHITSKVNDKIRALNNDSKDLAASFRGNEVRLSGRTGDCSDAARAADDFASIDGVNRIVTTITCTRR